MCRKYAIGKAFYCGQLRLNGWFQIHVCKTVCGKNSALPCSSRDHSVVVNSIYAKKSGPHCGHFWSLSSLCAPLSYFSIDWYEYVKLPFWVWTREWLVSVNFLIKSYVVICMRIVIRCFLVFVFFHSENVQDEGNLLPRLTPQCAELNKSPDAVTYEWPREATRLTFRFCMTCARSSLKSQRVLSPSVFCR